MPVTGQEGRLHGDPHSEHILSDAVHAGVAVGTDAVGWISAFQGGALSGHTDDFTNAAFDGAYIQVYNPVSLTKGEHGQFVFDVAGRNQALMLAYGAEASTEYKVRLFELRPMPDLHERVPVWLVRYLGTVTVVTGTKAVPAKLLPEGVTAFWAVRASAAGADGEGFPDMPGFEVLPDDSATNNAGVMRMFKFDALGARYIFGLPEAGMGLLLSTV